MIAELLLLEELGQRVTALEKSLKLEQRSFCLAAIAATLEAGDRAGSGEKGFKRSERGRYLRRALEYFNDASDLLSPTPAADRRATPRMSPTDPIT